MERGSYVAASAGLISLRKLDLVNNNLANVNTPGYKREILASEVQPFDKTFAKAMEKIDPFAKGDHERTPAAINFQSITDFSQGPIKQTQNPLDVALKNPNEFFVINTPEGQRYTRAGNFTLTGEGTLVTIEGSEVQGDGGAIVVNGIGARINPDGSVEANGTTVGRIQVVEIKDLDKLERAGNARFKLTEGTPGPVAVNPSLVTESLEMANVSAISSMVELIKANRGFQVYTKTAQSIDDLNQTAVNQIGRKR